MRALPERIALRADNQIWYFTNIYPTALIGRDNSIGAYTEIDSGVTIGDRNRIGAYCFIPACVNIGSDCFIGPRVTFTNDKYPPAGKPKWEYTFIEDKASIGAGVTILPGITVRKGALVGAGSVVTHDIPENEVWAGNPAKFMRKKNG